MYGLTFITLFTNLLLHISSGQRSGDCNTPFGEVGQCVPIQQCTPMWKIVTEAPRPLSQRVLQYLQQSICGSTSERRVCCRFQDVSEQFFSNNQGPTVATPVTTVAPVSTASSTNVLTHRNIRLLELKDCGPVSSDRIAFGNQTVLYEFPWMALLGYEDSESLSPEWSCGGSVISQK